MTKLIAITDFVHGKAIYKLPPSILKKNQKKIKILNIDNKKVNPDLVKIYWGTRINDKLLKKFKNLEWIHFGSTGTDKLSLNCLKNKKIVITNSRGINSESVAKLILIFLLDAEKKILGLNNKSNRNIYENRIVNSIDSRKNKILVLGYGNISKKLNSLISNLDYQISFFSNRSNVLKIKNVYNKGYILKNLKKYKLIINLLKYNNQNKEFINSYLMKKLDKQIIFILAGRIETVNLKHLIKFLKSNEKSYAYIDAKADTKNIKDFFKLKKLKNVFLTPHIGGYYNNYWKDQSNLFSDNLNKYLRGKKLKNIVKINKYNFL